MRVLFNSIALAGLIVATGATAQPAGDGYLVAIPYADLNLANPAGVAALKNRVEAQADQLCVGASDSPLQQSLQTKQCRAAFIHAAQRQLPFERTPVSGALHASR